MEGGFENETLLVRPVFIFLAGGVGLAGETSKTGILIDAMCAGAFGANQEKFVKHKVSCALMEPCVESGFGLFSGGEFYRFDSDGDAKALVYFQGLDQDAGNIRVEVTGDFSGGAVRVSQIASSP